MNSSVFGYGPPGAHPFGSPYLIVLDSIRVLILFLVIVNWMSMLIVYFKARRLRQNYPKTPDSLSEGRWLALTLAVFAGGLYVAETEWDHMGTPVGGGGRLWLGLTMMVLLFGWLEERRRKIVNGVG
jgi:hypothetical protein